MEDIRFDALKQGIVDESFDVNLIARYKLVVKLHQSLLSLCVFDSEDHRCLAYERFQLQEGNTPQKLVNYLENLWAAHQFLKAAFWKSVIFVSFGQDFSFVPIPMAEKEDAQSYLMINGSNLELKSIKNTKQWGLGVICYHSISSEIEQWIHKTYSESEILFYHVTSAFLKGCADISKNNPNARIFASTFQNNLLVSILEGEQLKFINSFTFKSPNDLVYYLLLVAQEYKLNPEKEMLTIWGDINEKSPMADLVHSYFKNVVFGMRPEGLKFGFIFDELPNHQAFDIFSAYKLSL
ncbi:MAG: hypothetical protein OHK0038_11120 [Flammeovirgaceae bacterium]